MRTDQICREKAKLRRSEVHRFATAGKGAAVAIIALLTIAILYAWGSGADLRSLSALGYPGVFLIAFLSSATVLLPVPGLAFSIGAGAIWQPIVVGLIGGLGAATGEMIGYFAGRAGLSVLRKKKGGRWLSVERGLRRFGFWAIFLVAAIPNPLFDALGLAAGALAYPVWRFWLAAAAGNTVKYIAFALIGSGIGFPIG